MAEVFRGAMLGTACLALTLSGEVVAGERGWLILENPYFKVYSSAKEARTRELMDELDQFRVAVQIITDLTIPENARRTEVVILDDDFSDLTNSRSIGGIATHTDKDAAGRTATIIVMPANKRSANEKVVIRHEYMHALNRFRPIRFPRWYEEGSAEVFSYTTVRNRLEIVVDVPADRIRNFKRNAGVGFETWESFDSIVAGEEHSSSGLLDHYLQYWLLTHYLIFGNPALAPNLERSLIYFDAGMPPLEAFTKAFGRTPESYWQEELFRYRRQIRSTHYTLKEPIAGLPFASRRDEAGEGEAVLKKLQADL